MSSGFLREQLRPRYDVDNIVEDEWHSFSEQRTRQIFESAISSFPANARILNAGSGDSKLDETGRTEVLFDLFASPIVGRANAICGTVEALPFPQGAFDMIVCTGEVLGYCDPAKAIREFSRVLKPSGVLLCDFGNSGSVRFRLTEVYRRQAAIVTVPYNGKPELTWVYDPSYIASILTSFGFRITKHVGIHKWSALLLKLGASSKLAVAIERGFSLLPFPKRWADTTTFVAVLEKASR